MNNFEITYKEKQHIFSILNNISLFGGLTDGELECLIPLLTISKFGKGEYIFKQGESPSNIYIVDTGNVKIEKSLDGVSVELAHFDEGDLFGETELIGIFKYIASAITLDDTKVLVFSKKAIYSLYTINIKLFSKIILNIAREACRRTAHTDEFWFSEMVKLNKSCENNKK